jgi:hypothetical protein
MKHASSSGNSPDHPPIHQSDHIMRGQSGRLVLSSFMTIQNFSDRRGDHSGGQAAFEPDRFEYEQWPRALRTRRQLTMRRLLTEEGMMRTHPHAEANYRVVPLDDGSFGVEVSIPDSQPTTVTKFDSEDAAEAWITSHRERVQSQTQIGRGFRGSRYGQRPG